MYLYYYFYLAFGFIDFQSKEMEKDKTIKFVKVTFLTFSSCFNYAQHPEKNKSTALKNGKHDFVQNVCCCFR